jgi:hypothetical protein
MKSPIAACYAKKETRQIKNPKIWRIIATPAIYVRKIYHLNNNVPLYELRMNLYSEEEGKVIGYKGIEGR